MTRIAYHRAPDKPLEAPNTRILARNLTAGDTLTAPGIIDLPITAVRPAICGLIVVDYEITAGAGQRTLVADSLVQIKPRRAEEAH